MKERGVYLLHFTQPHAHARHYLGWSDDIPARLEAHRKGQGARLVEAIVATGNSFTLVRTWPGATRADERRLKRRKHGPRLSPLCNLKGVTR